MVALPGEPEFLLPPGVVRANDTSATSIDEWTGACVCGGGERVCWEDGVGIGCVYVGRTGLGSGACRGCASLVLRLRKCSFDTHLLTPPPAFTLFLCCCCCS